MEKEVLEGQKKLLFIRLKESAKTLDLARQNACLAEKEYNKQKAEFELIDRQLAMLDGRYKKIEREVKAKGKVEVELTNEQLLLIAGQLGIDLKGE